MSRDQLNALEGLAHWIAELNWLRERKEEDAHWFEQARESIALCFKRCDVLGISFRTQNSVIVWAEDWRNLKREGVSDMLKRKNIA